MTRKRWREHPDGEEADRSLGPKRPGKDLWAALDQAKPKAGTDTKTTGHDLPPLFASDGMTYLRQIHAGEP